MALPSKKHSLIILFVALLLAPSLCLQAGIRPVAPPLQKSVSLMEYVMQQRPTLAQLITKAGLTPTLSGGGPYTLFAPPEDALQGWKSKSTEELHRLLLAYLVKGSYQESDLKDGATLDTMAGSKVTICRKKGQTLIDGVAILQADNRFSNGTLHGLAGPIAL
ncbi:fasciclin domain-containing protein [Pontibacter liquoris]|uniref:fasciclin domain-containing protein n=1 Tax=Pontibacter liquoris TaxID=2905677 RepID=UPI001FA746C1|nr:fasciclin domain-containing protein [Pontibacter liquoris]